MKKSLLALTLSLASLGFIASSPEAKTTTASIAPSAVTTAAPAQFGRDRRYRRGVRTRLQTRIVRHGRRAFRETYQVTYFPNGRTQTRLISRERVG